MKILSLIFSIGDLGDVISAGGVIPCLVAKIPNSKLSGVAVGHIAKFEDDPICSIRLRSKKGAKPSAWQRKILKSLLEEDGLAAAIEEGMREYSTSSKWGGHAYEDVSPGELEKVKESGIPTFVTVSEIVIDEVHHEVIIGARTELDGNLIEHGICIYLDDGKWRFAQGEYWSVYEALLRSEETAPKSLKKGGNDWEFIIACGDGGEFRQWLAAGGSLDQRNAREQTPLLVAITRGRTEIIQATLDHGVAPESVLAAAVQEHGWTAVGFVLEWARREGRSLTISADTFVWTLNGCGDVDLIQAMLDFGAPVDAQVNGLNALFYATAEIADPEIVGILLHHGAPLGQADSTQSALANAIRKEQIETVKLLLDAGADLYAIPSFTKTQQYLNIEKQIEFEQTAIADCERAIEECCNQLNAMGKIRELERDIKMSKAVIARHNEALEFMRPKPPAFYLAQVREEFRDQFRAEVEAYYRAIR